MEEKSRVDEGHELPGGGGGGGVQGHASPESFSNEYALRCNLVHFETQSCRESCPRQGILTSSALTLSRLDDFSVAVTYPCIRPAPLKFELANQR